MQWKAIVCMVAVATSLALLTGLFSCAEMNCKREVGRGGERV